jgi:hypothetical protein
LCLLKRLRPQQSTHPSSTNRLAHALTGTTIDVSDLGEAVAHAEVLFEQSEGHALSAHKQPHEDAVGRADIETLGEGDVDGVMLMDMFASNRPVVTVAGSCHRLRSDCSDSAPAAH